MFDWYWPLPWAEVVAAADAGTDGLNGQSTPPILWEGQINQMNHQPDVRVSREGTGDYKGRTLLYQQNWFGPLIVIHMLKDTEVADEP